MQDTSIFNSAVAHYPGLKAQFAKATATFEKRFAESAHLPETSFKVAADGTRASLRAWGQDFDLSFRMVLRSDRKVGEFRVAMPATTHKPETLLFSLHFDDAGNVRYSDDARPIHLMGDHNSVSKVLEELTNTYFAHVA